MMYIPELYLWFPEFVKKQDGHPVDCIYCNRGAKDGVNAKEVRVCDDVVVVELAAPVHVYIIAEHVVLTTSLPPAFCM